MASKRKKNEARKAKKEGRRESESKSQDCSVSLLNPKTLEILLSAHARTSQAEGREEYDPQTALW